MLRIVLATGNPGKVRELADQLCPFGFEVIPQSQLGVHSVAETGLTFIENALLKARHAATTTGLPAIADDAGLTVDVLDGAPGLYSARYAGKQASDSDNRDKLLKQLQHVPLVERTAHFYAVLVYLRHWNDPSPLIGQGIWHGVITDTPVGNQGFGYDALFYLPSLRCTAAQLTRAQKNDYSHRGQALRQLLAQLTNA